MNKIQSMVNRVIILLMLSIGFGQSTGAADEVVQVVAGRQKVIEVGSPIDILMSDSRIATLDYTSGTKGVLIGQSPGSTSLTLRYAGGREVTKTIQVIARDPKQVVDELKELLSPIKTITFRIAGDRPIIEGTIASPEEAELFNKVMLLFPDVLNMARIKARQTMIGVSVKVIETDLSKTQDFNPIGSDVASLNGTYNKANNNQTGTIIDQNIGLSLTAQLLPKIEYWLGNGTAQLVADPVVTVINKEKAHFQIGGEIPFEYSTQNGMSVEWKNYGVILTLTPEWLESDEILLALEGEVSSVDESRQTSKGVPGVKTRRINTRVAVKNGESMIISGMKYKESSVFKKRLPVLGYLLPFLFYQRSVREEEKELIIVVTPTTPAVIDNETYGKIKSMKIR
jgi:pilus assembly protein CpaC